MFFFKLIGLIAILFGVVGVGDVLGGFYARLNCQLQLAVGFLFFFYKLTSTSSLLRRWPRESGARGGRL